MKMLTFAMRNSKEIRRDKINLFFGIGFPVILLLLLSLLQSHIQVKIFSLEILTPGIAVFGLSFISLFSGMLMAKDRESSFMLRLKVSPLSACDFILGYALPLLPMALIQVIICYITAVLLGMPVSVNIIWSILAMLPAAILFIGIGLFCGSCLNQKQVGGICGAALTNITVWLSGAWFDLALLGKTFERIAQCMPFVHAVQLGRDLLQGTADLSSFFIDCFWIIGYAAVFFLLAVVSFVHFGSD